MQPNNKLKQSNSHNSTTKKSKTFRKEMPTFQSVSQPLPFNWKCNDDHTKKKFTAKS